MGERDLKNRLIVRRSLSKGDVFCYVFKKEIVPYVQPFFFLMLIKIIVVLRWD